MIIYDPLDRDIKVVNESDDEIEGIDQATKRDDFLKKIDELKGFDGTRLQTPMDQDRFDSLIEMLQNKEKESYESVKKKV